VFDSWANLLSKEEFSLYVLPYWKRIKEALSHLNIPVIFFSRANTLYPELISSFSPHCISFDEGRPLAELRVKVPVHITIQGNFPQELLLNGTVLQVKEAALKMVRSVASEHGIIWNLGHGVLPKTPLQNVEALLKVLATI
jgi:uroporphyrinogen decarboxylase